MSNYRYVLPTLLIVTFLQGCMKTPDVNLRTFPSNFRSCNNEPGTCAGNNNVEVKVYFNGPEFDRVEPEEANVCKNGKVTLRREGAGFDTWGIIFSPDSDIDDRVSKRAYWTNNGELKVKVKNKAGCVGYTLIRKSAGTAYTLDPVFIIDN